MEVLEGLLLESEGERSTVRASVTLETGKVLWQS